MLPEETSFVSQWFPKVGVFENGKWVCSQYHPYLNFYSDFGDYSVKIKVPKSYTVAATGVEKEKSLKQILQHFILSSPEFTILFGLQPMRFYTTAIFINEETEHKSRYKPMFSRNVKNILNVTSRV